MVGDNKPSQMGISMKDTSLKDYLQTRDFTSGPTAQLTKGNLGTGLDMDEAS